MSRDVEYDTEDAVAVRRPPQKGKSGNSLGDRQDRLWKAAETLDNALDTLTHRMAPVLLPERADGALAGVAVDTEDVSDLGGFLDQLLDKLERLGRRVSTTSERIDL
jgi:hypothetical protein